MRFALMVAAALSLAACMEPPLPLATAEQDVAGKRFQQPSEGMGAIYIYGRSGNTQTIYVGPNMVGSLQGRSWLRIDLPPGTYDVRCTTPLALTGAVGSAVVALSAGELVYLYARESLASWSCPLDRQDPGTAQPAILAGRRVRELR